MKRIVLWLLVALSATTIGWIAADWDEFIERKFGRTYDIEDTNDLRDLKRLCYGLQFAVDRIEAQSKQTGHLPDEATFSEIVGGPFVETYPLLTYIHEAPNYRLYYKLNWDAYLEYFSDTRSWTFNPGNGDGAIHFKLSEPAEGP